MAAQRAALRDRLVDAAVELFAINGYRETSLRQISERAEASYASIHYHFGSKRALYDATLGEFRPEDMGRHFPPVPAASEMTREQAIYLFRQMVTTFVTLNARISENPIVAMSYVAREGFRGDKPNPDFYRRVIAPGHEAWKRLVKAMRPDIDDEKTLEVLVFNLIGQCLMVRIGRGVLLKRLKQRTVSKDDTALIAECILQVALVGVQDAEL
ncbi:MAG: CerR family C-terminal domain-containing protein [Planctomycetota bacterium]